MKRILPLMLAVMFAPAATLAQDAATSAQVKRGEYLVTTGLCHDCHTPLVMGPDGPAPDMKRALSGHPQDIVIKAPAPVSAPWMGGFSPTHGVVGPLGRELFREPHARRRNRAPARLHRTAVRADLAHRQASGSGTADPSADAVAVHRANDRRRPEGDLRLSAADSGGEEQGAGSAPAGAVDFLAVTLRCEARSAEPRRTTARLVPDHPSRPAYARASAGASG